jgi:chromosome partitioning protein
MALYLGVLSQKGGVGKSTVSRLLAREYAVNGWEIKIADFDTAQSTNYKWQSRRLARDIEPTIPVEQFKKVNSAIRVGEAYDLMILDGAAQTTQTTSAIAKSSDFIVIPTGTVIDDLEPAVILANDVVKDGVAIDRIALVLSRTGKSQVEINEARAYLDKTPYYIVPGELPESGGYKRASNQGKTPTETAFPALNERADKVAQALVNRFQKILDLREVA